MLGKPTLPAVPYHGPIVVVTLAVAALLGLGVVGTITYYREWIYLWTKWLTSVDHEKIDAMYIVVALVILVRGFADATMMRDQLVLAEGVNHGYLLPKHYDQIFTAYDVIMIIFMAIPLMTDLMNLVVPLQTGAHDVTLPFLNSPNFWPLVVSTTLANASLGPGEFARTGWVAYPPLSELAYSPGAGADYYIWVLQIFGTGTLPTGINFLVTVFKMHTPSMKLMQMPIFIWTYTFANVLIAASSPTLTAALGLLSLDRHLDMHFSTNELGNNAMMYINLFWVWGHLEVYVLILPTFGTFSEVIATFAGKHMFNYKSMIWTSAVITLLGFTVRPHYPFTMDSSSDINGFFDMATMLISIPTGVKLFNWLFTIYKGCLHFSTPILWTLGPMMVFTIGGMTGVLLVIPGTDPLLHDSLFLIAHFHNTIIGGVVLGYLVGFASWFPKAFGFTLDEKWGKHSFWCWLAGFYMVFIPLYVLGSMGMTRRLNHYSNPLWKPYLMVAFFGAMLIFCGIVYQLIWLSVSVRSRRQLADVSGDLWEGRALEWAIFSPPLFYNFAELSKVQDMDAFHDMKKAGIAYRKLPACQPIHMPKSTAAGFSIAVFAFVFDFVVIWYIWWLMVVGFVGMISSFVVYDYNQDVDYYIQPEEIEKTESTHLQ